MCPLAKEAVKVMVTVTVIQKKGICKSGCAPVTYVIMVDTCSTCTNYQKNKKNKF